MTRCRARGVNSLKLTIKLNKLYSSKLSFCNQVQNMRKYTINRTRNYFLSITSQKIYLVLR